jgi:tetratricopeptide (TPR) repeat protein
LLGDVHTNRLDAAQKELSVLKTLYDSLGNKKDKMLEAAQVAVQVNASEAWIQYKLGNHNRALELMKVAADMEDATEKHPVTPGAVIPARELLGDLLLEMNKPSLALEAFEQDLKIHPNRRNGKNGLMVATERARNQITGTK